MPTLPKYSRRTEVVGLMSVAVALVGCAELGDLMSVLAEAEQVAAMELIRSMGVVVGVTGRRIVVRLNSMSTRWAKRCQL